MGFRVPAVHLVQPSHGVGPGLVGNPLGGLQVRHRIPTAVGPECRALDGRREEAVGPLSGATPRVAVGVRKNHERGEVLVLRPQSVGHPRPHGRKSGQDEAGVHLCHCGHVVRALGDHAPHHGELVRLLREFRQEAAHPQAALAMLAELPRAPAKISSLSEKGRHRIGRAVPLLELGFEVERVDVAHSADREDLDDPLGTGREVLPRRGILLTRRIAQSLPWQQGSEHGPPESPGGIQQHAPPASANGHTGTRWH